MLTLLLNSFSYPWPFNREPHHTRRFCNQQLTFKVSRVAKLFSSRSGRTAEESKYTNDHHARGLVVSGPKQICREGRKQAERNHAKQPAAVQEIGQHNVH